MHDAIKRLRKVFADLQEEEGYGLGEIADFIGLTSPALTNLLTDDFINPRASTIGKIQDFLRSYTLGKYRSKGPLKHGIPDKFEIPDPLFPSHMEVKEKYKEFFKLLEELIIAAPKGISITIGIDE